MQNIRTLYDEALQNCHSEPFGFAQDKLREESNTETLRFAQGDNSGVPIWCRLIQYTTLQAGALA